MQVFGEMYVGCTCGCVETEYEVETVCNSKANETENLPLQKRKAIPCTRDSKDHTLTADVQHLT